MVNADRIEKKVLLRAPLERVWQAISDARRFGAWFGVEFEGQFSAGATMRGRIVPTQVDPEVAKLQEPHRGKAFTCVIDRIEPMRRFSFRWHPFAIEPDRDYSKEAMTLVEFELKEQGGATELTITESGFAALSPERSREAFGANEGGWSHQAKLIERYLATLTEP